VEGGRHARIVQRALHDELRGGARLLALARHGGVEAGLVER
jgi:hypothetical protein